MDDWKKISKGNSRGISPREKLVLQIGGAGGLRVLAQPIHGAPLSGVVGGVDSGHELVRAYSQGRGVLRALLHYPRMSDATHRAQGRLRQEGDGHRPHGLRNVFEQFKNWLIGIYRGVEGLNVPE